MNRIIKHFYEFGPFLLDVADGLLLREGQHVPLTPKAYETLLALVESNGHVIDKEELIKKIWPDTFVEEANLAKNVSILRKILGGEQSDQYIETIPKRGYRFVASVREVLDEPKAPDMLLAAPPVSDQIEKPRSSEQQVDQDIVTQRRGMMSGVNEVSLKPRSLAGRLIWPAALLAVCVVAGTAIWLILNHQGSGSSGLPLKIVPFTSFPGHEIHPSFSADGNRIAFVWDGENADNPDIFVKEIGVDQPRRLTTNPAADTHPVWSPDGRFIAFLRQDAESCAYYLIPSSGGVERKIADVFRYLTPTLGNSQYYSLDGKSLAVRDKNSPEEPSSICLLSIDNGEKRRLTSPSPGTVGDSYPAFSPDGEKLAFLRSTSLATTDIYVMPLAGGLPGRLTSDNTSILGLAWTADSREIVFASRRDSSTYNLWRIPATGGAPKRLPEVGQRAISPTISRQGNRLAFTQMVDDENIWRVRLDASGRGSALAPLISSTQFDNGPDYAPDGRKIVFASNRTGDFGIWVCGVDGLNPVQLVNRGPYLTGTPRWSPDGNWIAYDSRSSGPGREGCADIYVISATGGPGRRLTTEASENVAPSWSRNGKWIYFGSTRSGSMQIWKVPAEGGPAMQVTRHGGFEGFESTEGKILYYAKGRSVPGIWQIPVTGGEESLTLDHDQAGFWRLWTVVEKGIYFATASTPSRPVIEFFDFATRKVTRVVAIEKRLNPSDPGLSVSPDRLWLLFTQLDQSGSDIMLVESFR
jgi:Tol biopolymer transport system component/DNA-binding winged helix-turn-helix (wHTH) protein